MLCAGYSELEADIEQSSFQFPLAFVLADPMRFDFKKEKPRRNMSFQEANKRLIIFYLCII